MAARGYTGTLAGVTFDDGVPAEGQDVSRETVRSILGYARRHGLRVLDDRLVVASDELKDVPEVPSTVKVGTPLRDAAVDPKADDFLPPINAGRANPHGPFVVAPHVHGAPDRRITEGPVVESPPAQEQAETAATVEQLDVDVEQPARNASQAEWATYAIAQGADPDEAAAATRAELIDRYGGED